MPHSFLPERPSPVGAVGSPMPTLTSNNGAPSNNNEAPGSSMTIAENISARVERALQNDQERTNLLQELLYRHEYASQELERTQSERNLYANWQAEKQGYADRERQMQSLLFRNPFVIVLIDGDGMIFRDHFICEGEQGGRQAAAQLHAAITRYLQESNAIPTESRILCRVYANVGGLAEALVRSGSVDDVTTFEDFVRGFTRGKTLFDFVDVGPGKDRADKKIIESFKVFIDDYHCRQIFFGCSHDNGFARLLEDHVESSDHVSTVTLLEGVPFEKELVDLPYKTTKLPDIFRDTKISAFGAPSLSSPVAKNYNIITGLPTRFPASRASSAHDIYGMESPVLGKLGLNMARTPSTSTLASDGAPAVRPVMASWASKAAAPAPPASATPQYQPANRDEVIARNRLGQRVDPPCRDYDKTEVDRIKKIKMCNVHFLRKECPYKDNCTHLHNYQPTAAELATLRLVARMAPCQHGTACQDIKCIYGHRCPAPLAKTKPLNGTKPCIFGDTCKFPDGLHEIDCNVVKTVVIR